MKTRKLLSLVLAIIMLLGCMTVTAFAEEKETFNVKYVGANEDIVLDYDGSKKILDVKKELESYIGAPYDYIVLTFSGKLLDDSKTLSEYNVQKDSTVHAVLKAGGIYLDLEESTSKVGSSKDIDQNYTFTQTSEEYTDVTKVKLEWTISDISATYKSHKTWDSDNLKWVEAKEDVSVTNESATFTLTNYSSKAVVATASFAVETALKDTFTEPTFTNNGCTVATPVVKDTTTTYQDSDFTALKQTITATLTLNKDKFADLTATTSATKYGTYTVTISAVPTVSTKYLKFTALENNSTITPNFKSGTWEYSIDGGTIWNTGKIYTEKYFDRWDEYAGGVNKYSTDGGTTWSDEFENVEDVQTTIVLNEGQSVLLKGTNCITGRSSDELYEYKFSMTGSIAASGDVTNLTNGGIGGDVALTTDSCYSYMFYNCTSLTTTPALPSTTLSYRCYWSMFYGCTNLTTVPVLSATTLVEGCYGGMFYGCTGLTTAPNLPASIMVKECYMCMFQNCTSLTEAPALNATTLAYNCYGSMFLGCTSLTTAPTLSVTNLVDFCYSNMFENCTSLTTAPTLPATTLVECCYQNMFKGCSSLKISKGEPSTYSTKGVIFTCPDTAGINSPVDYMLPSEEIIDEDPFTGEKVYASITPKDGITYYWYTE